MGIIEADEDGVEHYYDPKKGARGHRGAEVYVVKCDVCGREMKVVNYGRGMTFVCDKCKNRRIVHKREIEQAWFEVIEEKGERRFNQALDKIQSQVKNFSKYENAIRVARTCQDKYGSIPEAMVAVELLRHGYFIIPQQKVGRYRVDFYLPDDKLVIEVDGGTFHHNGINGKREATLQFSLGLDVTIIHVPAEWISKNITKLRSVIKAQTKRAEKNRNRGT